MVGAAGDGESLITASQTFFCLSLAVTQIFQIWKFLGPVSVGHTIVSEADMARVHVQMLK